MKIYNKINYEELNTKQKENYNFQKISAHLADYGFNCLRLSDDWQGADFIACHISGSQFLKVQLKGRLTVNKKYEGRRFILHSARVEHGIYIHMIKFGMKLLSSG